MHAQTLINEMHLYFYTLTMINTKWNVINYNTKRKKKQNKKHYRILIRKSVYLREWENWRWTLKNHISFKKHSAYYEVNDFKINAASTNGIFYFKLNHNKTFPLDQSEEIEVEYVS